MNDVERNIQSIKELCANHGVEKLYLFGSILGKDFNEKSDLKTKRAIERNLEIIGEATN
jgi:predicted nucleotidyltransferase